MKTKKGFIGRIFSALNTFRKLTLNILFFMLLILVVVAISGDDNTIIIEDNTALILNLHGDIVEQKQHVEPIDAFLSEALQQQEEKPEVLLSDILAVINSAKDDVRINTLVLKLQNLKSAGLTKMRYIAKAVKEFKESGKKVIAVGDQYSQDQYYLASFADEIWLDPKGWMLLDGYGRYQMYFKSALDKLSISQHIFRVGTYKSAVEPYMRDDMSVAAKEANKLWLNDLWQIYKTDVAEQRGFGLENFDENTDQILAKLAVANGNVAEYALQNNWVDQLKTRDEIFTDLTEIVGRNEDKGYNSVSFNNYLTTITPSFPIIDPSTDKIAIIVAKGTILNGTQKPGSIGGDSTAKLLKKARKNDNVKAVVLRVDSPGGSAYASEIIRQEVELLKASGKKVIASMGTYAASGGYWISAPADKIFASPTTITGSIGIFGFFMTFENTLSKLGIHTDGVGTTELAGFGVTRPLTDGMAQIFQLGINRGYQDFITLVAENRNMTLEQVDKIAQGRVWSGSKAKELGLVDELGDLNAAIDAAAELAGLTKFDTLYIEEELSPKDKLLNSFLEQAASYVPTSDNTTTNPIRELLQTLQQELTALAELNDPQGIYSFCLTCEIH